MTFAAARQWPQRTFRALADGERARPFRRRQRGTHLPRTASFKPPTALRIFPLTLFALPSAVSFLSPVAFPATSLTLPLACSAEPLMRFLSMGFLSNLCCENEQLDGKFQARRPRHCASGHDQ